MPPWFGSSRRLPALPPRPARVDAVVVAAVVILGATGPSIGQSGLIDPLWWMAAAASAGALRLGRRHGLLTALAIQVVYLGANDAGFAAASETPWGGIFAMAVVAYALGARERPERGGPALTALVGATLLVSDGSAELIGAIAAALWLLVAYALGLAVGTGQRRRQTVRDVALQRDQAREEWIRGAVEAERARMARDLHDALGHSVSLIVLQAGAVRTRLEPHQHAERAALLATEQAGRDSVAELRRMLHILRAPHCDSVAPASLTALSGLVSNVRAAGVAVTVTTAGSPLALPPGLDVAAYRIVQEALTNVIKHARSARVEVALMYEPTVLTIEVSDDGGVGASQEHVHDGQGLIGIRERVALYGGRLDAGPTPNGGFAVRAEFPVAAEDAA